jgi:serine/threonine protein kinase
MSLCRKDFTPVKTLAAGQAGAMNAGIILVRMHKGAKAIEKRFDPSSIRAGFAARELKTMERCNHGNICAFLGSDLDPHRYGYGSVYMEYCELGSLEMLIKQFARRKVHIPEGFLWKVLWDISLALCYLQTGVDTKGCAKNGMPMSPAQKKKDWEEVIHCDIKPGNIFLTMRDSKGQYPTVVLGDFGCSVSDPKRHKMHPMMDAWTSSFAPPEAPQYSDASDIYSTALSVHCMALLGSGPVSDGEKLRREPLGADGGSRYSGTLARLLKRTLAKSVNDRPDAPYLPYLVWREKQQSKKELGENHARSWKPLPSWSTD